jgi:hypothetical protein
VLLLLLLLLPPQRRKEASVRLRAVATRQRRRANAAAQANRPSASARNIDALFLAADTAAGSGGRRGCSAGSEPGPEVPAKIILLALQAQPPQPRPQAFVVFLVASGCFFVVMRAAHAVALLRSAADNMTQSEFKLPECGSPSER